MSSTLSPRGATFIHAAGRNRRSGGGGGGGADSTARSPTAASHVTSPRGAPATRGGGESASPRCAESKLNSPRRPAASLARSSTAAPVSPVRSAAKSAAAASAASLFATPRRRELLRLLSAVEDELGARLRALHSEFDAVRAQRLQRENTLDQLANVEAALQAYPADPRHPRANDTRDALLKILRATPAAGEKVDFSATRPVAALALSEPLRSTITSAVAPVQPSGNAASAPAGLRSFINAAAVGPAVESTTAKESSALGEIASVNVPVVGLSAGASRFGSVPTVTVLPAGSSTARMVRVDPNSTPSWHARTASEIPVEASPPRASGHRHAATSMVEPAVSNDSAPADAPKPRSIVLLDSKPVASAASESTAEENTVRVTGPFEVEYAES